MRAVKRFLVALILWRAFAPTISPRFRPPQEHPWRTPGRTVFVGDQEFVVREAGPEDGKVVLLIHGLAGSSLAEWYRIGPTLAERYRLIMLDHRNHGLAPMARDRFEVDDLADDLAGVLDQLGVGAVSVIGYSMGGTIAQAVAHRHPGRVDKLMLIATFARHPEPDRTLRSIGAVLARGWERLTGLGTPEVRSGYLRLTGAVEERHARWLWEETHRRDVDAGAQATLALLRFDSTAWVGRLEVETRVVIPTHDQLVPPAWQYELAGLIPGSTVVELVGAHHEAPWTHPERLVDEISRFLG
jgi:pimeloyl-ACP methyl ester carboxylesterase